MTASVVCIIMTSFHSKDVHVLIPGTGEYVIWQEGNKAADGIKITNQLTMRWVDCFGLSGG